MIAAVAAAEFRMAWRDGRARWVAALLAVLFAASAVYAGARWRAVDADRRAAEAATYAQWLDQGEKNPHGAAHYGLYAFKPETVLAYAERGVNDHAGSVVWLEAHKQNRAEARPAQDGDAMQRFGALSLGHALLALAPLLVILLGHGVWARERETGVLRQTLAAGAPPSALVWGKTLGAGATVVAALLPAVAAAAVAGAVSAPGGQAAARSLLMGALALAAVLTWTFLALGVSARARTAQGALVLLIGLWLASVFLAPRLVYEVARLASAPPSAAAVSARIARELQADPATGRTQKAYLEERTQALLRRYGANSREALPVNLSGYTLNWSEDWGDRVFDRVWGETNAALRGQERIAGLLGLVSPTLPARRLAAAAADTDLESQMRFQAEGERYRRAFVRELNAYLAAHSRTGQRYTASPDYWAEIEPFTPSASSLAQSLRPYGVEAAGVLMWLIGSAAFALWAGRRVRPEAE